MIPLKLKPSMEVPPENRRKNPLMRAELPSVSQSTSARSSLISSFAMTTTTLWREEEGKAMVSHIKARTFRVLSSSPIERKRGCVVV